MTQFIGFVDEADSCFEGDQIWIDFVFFLLVAKELLFKLILASDNKAAFSAQRHGYTNSIKNRLKGVFGPGLAPIGIAVWDEDVAVSHLL